MLVTQAEITIMTGVDEMAAREWIARLRAELYQLELDRDPRDVQMCRIAEGIREEIIRVERLILATDAIQAVEHEQ